MKSSSATQQITTLATATVEVEEREFIIHLGGDWELHVPVPSWEETIKTITTAKTRVSSITITAKELGAWDSALLLFLIHGRAWCLHKKIPLDISSLPPGIQRVLAHREADPCSQATAVRAPAVGKAARKHHSSLCSRFRYFVGSITLAWLQGIKETTEFVGNCTLGIAHILTRNQQFRWKDCLIEMQACWSSSLPIVSFISFLVGVILAFQAAIPLTRYGAGILVVDLVSLSIVREMGPMMAAIVVAGGTGAGFAARLGNMKVGEELDALHTLGISTINFLVLPRLLAVTIMMPILGIYANVLGILGGIYISATMLHIPAALYCNEMHHRVSFTDVASGVIKLSLIHI